MTEAHFLAARHVHGAHHLALLARPGVVACGVGLRRRNGVLTDQHVIKVFVVRKRPLADLHPVEILPAALSHGEHVAEIDVEEMPAPVAPPRHPASERSMMAEARLRVPRRPLVGGASLAHHDFPTGTLAIGVTDNATGIRYALSCNHVLAMQNTARAGDAVLQPARDDGGRYPRDAVGMMVRYVPIRFDCGPNMVDAALAALPPGAVRQSVDLIGAVSESVDADTLRPGDIVHKVGRTTGLTEGPVLAVDVSMRVAYHFPGFPAGTAMFVRQIIAHVPCAYGDSGSLLLDGQNRAVGLLFGGTEGHTYFNPFTEVEKALDVRLFRDA